MPKVEVVSPSIPEYILFVVMSLLVLFFLGKAICSVREDQGTNIHKGLYKKAEPFAQNIKIVLQMFVGTGLAFLIILKIFYLMNPSLATTFFPRMLQLISGLRTLEIIGFALIYSTAIDLAYMLFTDGPDEAIHPLITGLAAAILLGVSDPRNFTPQGASTIALSVVVLAALFLIDNKLVHLLMKDRSSGPPPQPQETQKENDTGPRKRTLTTAILGYLSLICGKLIPPQKKNSPSDSAPQPSENWPEEKPSLPVNGETLKPPKGEKNTQP